MNETENHSALATLEANERGFFSFFLVLSKATSRCRSVSSLTCRGLSLFFPQFNFFNQQPKLTKNILYETTTTTHSANRLYLYPSSSLDGVPFSTSRSSSELSGGVDSPPYPRPCCRSTIPFQLPIPNYPPRIPIRAPGTVTRRANPADSPTSGHRP